LIREISILALATVVGISVVAAQTGKGTGNQNSTANGPSQGGGQGPTQSQGQTPGAASVNGPFETVMLANGALDQLMQGLARRACIEARKGNANENPPLIVIVDQASLANLAAYDAFDRTVRFLQMSYESMIPPPSAITLLTSAIPSAAATTINVVSGAGFNMNDTIQIDQEQMVLVSGGGTTWTVARGENETMAVTHNQFAQVIDLTAINAPPAPVATPAVAGAGGTGDTFADITSAVTSALIAGTTETASTVSIQDVSAAIKLAMHLNSDTFCATNSTEIVYPGIYGSAGDLADFENRLVSVTNARGTALAGLAVIPLPTGMGAQTPLRITAFNSIDTTYNQFIQNWFGITSSGQSGLTPIVEGYALRERLTVPADANRQVYAVFVNVATAGGTMQDKKNAITALVTGDRISYSGGVVVNAMIFRKSSPQSVLYSDVLRYRTPLTRLVNPIHKNSTHYGDNLGDTCPQDNAACKAALANQQ
jgi:hypothetical protein